MLRITSPASPMRIVLLTLAATVLTYCASPVDGAVTTWTSFNAARADMETLIKGQANYLQLKYRDIVEVEGNPTCPSNDMCDETSNDWNLLVSDSQFLDTDSSCTNIDLDIDGDIRSMNFQVLLLLPKADLSSKYLMIRTVLLRVL
jgi:hypothetical protein